MPKKVMHHLVRTIIRDINAHYAVGDRYKTIKTLAEELHASTQTVQRALKHIADQGRIRAVPRSGIIITARQECRPVADRQLVLVSSTRHSGLNNAYLTGARQEAEPLGITVTLEQPPGDINPAGLNFGRFLSSRNADGIISLSLYSSYLGLYHAVREGLDVVCDLKLPELPDLPSVQFDGYRHCFNAGTLLRNSGFRRLLVIGAVDLEQAPLRGILVKRYRGMCDGFGNGNDSRITYCNMLQPDLNERLNGFFSAFSGTSAVFSLQSAANWLTGSKFMEYGLTVERGNLIVNNTYDGDFAMQGLPPVHAIAPSVRDLGAALTRKMVRKWQTGEWDDPLHEKI